MESHLSHKQKNLMSHKSDRLSKTVFVVQKRNLADEQIRAITVISLFKKT